jgi:hypothetical protein
MLLTASAVFAEGDSLLQKTNDKNAVTITSPKENETVTGEVINFKWKNPSKSKKKPVYTAYLFSIQDGKRNEIFRKEKISGNSLSIKMDEIFSGTSEQYEFVLINSSKRGFPDSISLPDARHSVRYKPPCYFRLHLKGSELNVQRGIESNSYYEDIFNVGAMEPFAFIACPYTLESSFEIKWDFTGSHTRADAFEATLKDLGTAWISLPLDAPLPLRYYREQVCEKISFISSSSTPSVNYWPNVVYSGGKYSVNISGLTPGHYYSFYMKDRSETYTDFLFVFRAAN